MTHEQEIKYLAKLAKAIYINMRDPNWGIAIHRACRGNSLLKKEVGRVLGKRGAQVRTVNRIVKKAEERENQSQKQMEFDF